MEYFKFNRLRYFGCVIFDDTYENVVLVHNKNNKRFRNTSFAKGEIENNETPLECAIREVFEECGRSKDELLFANHRYIAECSVKGNYSVGYFVCKTTTVRPFTFDTSKHEEVRWYSINEARELLKGNCGILFNEAIIVSDEAIFVPYDHFDPSPIFEIEDPCFSTKKIHSTTGRKYISTNTVGRSLTQMLRHDITSENLSLDEEGYVSVDSVLNLYRFKDANIRMIHEIVKADSKQRFDLEQRSDGYYIRCNQGHSGRNAEMIDISKSCTLITTPPALCIHGTTREAWESIKATGLKPMSRSHIHFAKGRLGDEGVISGYRPTSSKEIVLNCELFMRDGGKLYMSKNGVILTDGINGVIHPRYFLE